MDEERRKALAWGLGEEGADYAMAIIHWGEAREALVVARMFGTYEQIDKAKEAIYLRYLEVERTRDEMRKAREKEEVQGCGTIPRPWSS